MRKKRILVEILCFGIILIQTQTMAVTVDQPVSGYLKGETTTTDTPYGAGQQQQQQDNDQYLQNAIKHESSGSTGILGQSSASGNHTIDEVIEGGKNFIEAGKNQQSKIDGTNLQTASDTLYNMLLAIGIVIAVIVGIYLGIKFMISSAEDKAKVKESLIPYIAGCVVIFGAFIIWKLVILLLNGIA